MKNSSELAFLYQINEAKTYFNWESASFLANRLLQLYPTEINKTILAEIYFYSNNYSLIYELLKDSTSDKNRFIFAKACFKLNKMSEAENAILQNLHIAKEDSIQQNEKDTNQFLVNITKKGLNSFTDFFVRKKKDSKINQNKETLIASNNNNNNNKEISNENLDFDKWIKNFNSLNLNEGKYNFDNNIIGGAEGYYLLGQISQR